MTLPYHWGILWHICQSICRSVSTVRHFLSSKYLSTVREICRPAFPVYLLPVHSVKSKNSPTLQKLLTHGGLDISLRKRKRHCPLPYRSLFRRNRSFVILQDLVYIISAKFLTHISFILEWHWQWRSCVWEHPWIWQPQQKKKRLTSKGQVISLVVLSWECWLLSGPTLIALLKSTGENDADVWIVAGRRLLPWETYSATRMF